MENKFPCAARGKRFAIKASSRPVVQLLTPAGGDAHSVKEEAVGSQAGRKNTIQEEEEAAAAAVLTW